MAYSSPNRTQKRKEKRQQQEEEKRRLLSDRFFGSLRHVLIPEDPPSYLAIGGTICDRCLDLQMRTRSVTSYFLTPRRRPIDCWALVRTTGIKSPSPYLFIQINTNKPMKHEASRQRPDANRIDVRLVIQNLDYFLFPFFQTTLYIYI